MKDKHSKPLVTHFRLLKRAVRKKFAVKASTPEESEELTAKKLEWWWTKFHAARRRRVWRQSERQNHRCCYCTRLTWVYDGTTNGDPIFVPDRLPGMGIKQMATADHYVATVHGGTERPDNMVMCCMRCNTLRGDMDAHKFWHILQDPIRLAALIKRRGLTKEEKQRETTAKRRVKYDQLVLWLGYLFYVSPNIRSVFDGVLAFIEHEYAKREAVKLIGTQRFLQTYEDLLIPSTVASITSANASHISGFAASI